ncbi:uncharacterized protein METZ01_LOCUS305836, partial [marine metagenome]
CTPTYSRFCVEITNKARREAKRHW